MSHVTIRYLYCDGENCPLQKAAFDHAPDVNSPIEDQRRKAAFNGWRVGLKGGKDYCPDCWALETGERTPYCIIG